MTIAMTIAMTKAMTIAMTKAMTIAMTIAIKNKEDYTWVLLWWHLDRTILILFMFYTSCSVYYELNFLNSLYIIIFRQTSFVSLSKVNLLI